MSADETFQRAKLFKDSYRAGENNGIKIALATIRKYQKLHEGTDVCGVLNDIDDELEKER